MKIALSASFWDDPDVVKELHSCDLIYTTQAQNYKELCELFGEEKIRIIPDSRADMRAFLKRRWIESEKPDRVEFIDYLNLYDIHYKVKKGEEDGKRETL